MMEYEEIKLLKQSQKSSVYLVREKDGAQTFIKKVLNGSHPIYTSLQKCTHPFIPQVYEVTSENGCTTVLEEYIEGSVADSGELSEKQAVQMIKELCSALEFLHGKNIIHRDIKPSNIILAKDGHIRLIDFDAARTPKDDLEQDTHLLGTRGYAPPEQYGFSQTDERADIYALGVTLKQLLGKHAGKPRYKRIIRKCTELNPDQRYQSVRQVKRALSHTNLTVFSIAAAILLAAVIGIAMWPQPASDGTAPPESAGLTVLPAPANPHWDGETGTALWENVLESGVGSEVRYLWRLYRCDTPTPPDLANDEWGKDGDARGNVSRDDEFFPIPLADELWDNGYYYFAVCASGDGVQYADSPYVLSDVFQYTGESAPRLPAPTDLSWRITEGDESRRFYATFDMEPYEDQDMFYIFVYDSKGDYVMSTYWHKSDILEREIPGIPIKAEFISVLDESFRFAVQVLTSRPNEYRSSPAVSPYPPSDAYFSPWFNNSAN